MPGSDMQGGFDIATRNFLDFIAVTPSLQNNATVKVSSVTRSGGGRIGGNGSDRGSSMPSDSDVQASMVAIKNKYFRGSERGYLTTTEYKKMSKAQQQAVCRLCPERDGSSSNDAGTGTLKDYSNPKRQVGMFSKMVDDSLTTNEPSSDEDSDKKKNVKFRGWKSNPVLGCQ